MAGEVERMISRYGNAMTLVHEETAQEIRAFLQDTRSKSRENLRPDAMLLGELYGGMFIYIGPAEPAAARGDVLLYQGRRFVLRRAEPVTVQDRTVYVWGLCVEKDGETEWVS